MFASEIFVREKFEIDKYGKSVSYDGAVSALEVFYLNLINSGITEQ